METFDKLCRAADAHLTDDIRRERDDAIGERDDARRARERAQRALEEMKLARDRAQRGYAEMRTSRNDARQYVADLVRERDEAQAALKAKTIECKRLAEQAISDREGYRATVLKYDHTIEMNRKRAEASQRETELQLRNAQAEIKVQLEARIQDETARRELAETAEADLREQLDEQIQNVQTARARIAELETKSRKRAGSVSSSDVPERRGAVRQRLDAGDGHAAASALMHERDSRDDTATCLKRRQTETGKWQVLIKSRPSRGITSVEINKWFGLGYWMESQARSAGESGDRWDVVWGDSWINRECVSISERAFRALPL